MNIISEFFLTTAFSQISRQTVVVTTRPSLQPPQLGVPQWPHVISSVLWAGVTNMNRFSKLYSYWNASCIASSNRHHVHNYWQGPERLAPYPGQVLRSNPLPSTAIRSIVLPWIWRRSQLHFSHFKVLINRGVIVLLWVSVLLTVHEG